ncbi:type II toxin-antitoxin system PemK/MazF family toxin [Microbacterium sp.]|uniref:type II toxin-antitoxin system PemK/MazF family toxin n=1 Tax=Microbacterium sp. TaxID=51671 RepID=UPI003A8DE5FE
MVKRGDVVIVDFGVRVGSAPAKRRPAVVVQSDRFNASRLNTCVVVALTSNLALAEYPGNVFLPMSATGLRRDSIAVATQVATLDLAVVIETVTALPPTLLDEIDRGLRLVLDL